MSSTNENSSSMIKKIIPVVIIILFIVLAFIVYTMIRNANAIKYTEFRGEIYKVAEEVLDSSKLTMETRDVDPSGKIEAAIIYTIKDDTLSAEEYDEILKNEVTKVYNEIKDKKIINDTKFKTDQIDPLGISFTICLQDGSQYKLYLGIVDLDYSFESGWDENYQKAMNKKAVTEDMLEKALSTKGDYLSRR